MDILFQGLGWVGAFGLLSGYFLNSTNRLSSESRVYQWLNFIAALMLAINAYHINSIPFLIINCFWAMVALLSIVKKKSKETKGTISAKH